MGRLGMFNIVYGGLGLVAAFIIAFVLPVNPMPRAMTIASATASAYIMATGFVLRIYGDRAYRAVKRFVVRHARRLLGMKPVAAATTSPSTSQEATTITNQKD